MVSALGSTEKEGIRMKKEDEQWKGNDDDGSRLYHKTGKEEENDSDA